VSTRLRCVLLLFLVGSTSLAAETTLSAGVGTTFDPYAANPVSPSIDATLLGDLSWVPTDRLGFFMDWSAGGGYEPLPKVASALAATTVDGSYVVDKFLTRLSVSSVASYSSAEPFYGAASSELLFSYGGPEFSIYAAPRFSLVETTYLAMQVGGRAGIALLLADSILLKPAIEGGMTVPGGAAAGWTLMPSLSLDWYAGGQLTLGIKGGYRRSYSTVLSTLVSGGALLPLDTYERVFLVADASWLTKKGLTISARLPANYTLKSYDAYDGSVSLGTPAWLAELLPEASITIPISKQTDIVVSADGDLGISNNIIEQVSAVSLTARVELHF